MIKSITVLGSIKGTTHNFTAQQGQRGKFTGKYLVFPSGQGNNLDEAVPVDTLEEAISYMNQDYLIRVYSKTLPVKTASRSLRSCVVNY